MHELALTQSILSIVREEAEKRRIEQVLSITLKIGKLSGVMPPLIQEYFNLAGKGTVAEGARLILDEIPAVISCLNCNNETQLQRPKFRCPHCDSLNIQLISGREFYIDSIEVE